MRSTRAASQTWRCGPPRRSMRASRRSRPTSCGRTIQTARSTAGAPHTEVSTSTRSRPRWPEGQASISAVAGGRPPAGGGGGGGGGGAPPPPPPPPRGPPEDAPAPVLFCVVVVPPPLRHAAGPPPPPP